MATTRLTISQAAARLGVSERTVWRRIRSGALAGERDGRRVLVPFGTGSPAAGEGRRVGEASVGYELDTQLPDELGTPARPWPYTPENIEKRRRMLLARRQAARAEMDRLSPEIKPDPDGLTAADYIRADRDHPRALEGSQAADRAIRAMGRARRRRL